MKSCSIQHLAYAWHIILKSRLLLMLSLLLLLPLFPVERNKILWLSLKRQSAKVEKSSISESISQALNSVLKLEQRPGAFCSHKPPQGPLEASTWHVRGKHSRHSSTTGIWEERHRRDQRAQRTPVGLSLAQHLLSVSTFPTPIFASTKF